MTASVLVADCRDSFVYTIVDYLKVLGAAVTVRRADSLDPETVDFADWDAVLLSPGPGAPEDAKVCHRLLDRAVHAATPLLGVCLGHQVIAQHYGAEVSRASQPRHGETSQVRHDDRGVFDGLPNPFTATRYHSLAVRPAGRLAELEITARTTSGTVMGVRHRRYAVEGVQFHPEAVQSQYGHDLLRNWLSQTVRPLAG